MRDILATPAFVRAALTGFFFFFSQNGFVLLPLYVKPLGGSKLEIGLVVGVYRAVGIVIQPLLLAVIVSARRERPRDVYSRDRAVK